MNVEKLAQVVDEMIVQHDYPGFEARALKLGLPESLTRAPAKMFAQALGHESIYVRLAALRWFQERPGHIKPHLAAILGLVKHEDPWIRQEAVRTVERFQRADLSVALKIIDRLEDTDVEVRRGAAKALGKICGRLKTADEAVVEALTRATEDADAEVRRKADKALRKMGAYGE